MDGFVGEIRAFPFYVPDGWLACDGSTYPITQYQPLYSIIGNNFSRGLTPPQGCFFVPDLRGQVLVGAKTSDGDFSSVGCSGGNVVASMNYTQMASHTHSINAVLHTADQIQSITNQPSSQLFLTNTTNKPASGTPLAVRTFAAYPASAPSNLTQLSAGSVTAMGGGAAHENRQPYLTFTYCICYIGEYPIRP